MARLDQGALAGTSSGRIVAFKGIPYAAPPVGALRWKPPQPAASWTGARPATAFGPSCLQPTGAANIGGDPGPVSEDCLTLNVWAPRGSHGLPVMVWIHGGGHRFGSASQPYYDGAPFARDGVVFVSFNYRLAGLGFFAHPALTREAGPKALLGNYGLMDQMAALAWVKRNARAFGGDPRNVTLFGESSSALDVQALMAAPAASGLFQKAIVESSCDWDEPTSLAQREQDGLALAAKAGLGPDATAAELRALPGGAFLDPRFEFEFAPFEDGRLLTRTVARAFADGRVPAIPLMLGSNSYEGAVAQNLDGLKGLARLVGGLYPNHGEGEAALRTLDTDRYFGAPCRWIARQQSRAAPTFLYRFSYLTKAARAVLPGAPHGSELPYVFDGWPLAAPAEDRAMAHRLHHCWISFAKAGRPLCPGAPAWPAYARGKDQLMNFDVATTVQSGVRAAQYDALERLVLPDILPGSFPAADRR
ncbi:MAG TPA: carboxylesterase family protein [Caulobacteraceae bacterium]